VNCKTFLDQELITYRYSSCCCWWWGTWSMLFRNA